jgi:hypothetical protein
MAVTRRKGTHDKKATHKGMRRQKGKATQRHRKQTQHKKVKRGGRKTRGRKTRGRRQRGGHVCVNSNTDYDSAECVNHCNSDQGLFDVLCNNFCDTDDGLDTDFCVSIKEFEKHTEKEKFNLELENIDDIKKYMNDMTDINNKNKDIIIITKVNPLGLDMNNSKLTKKLTRENNELLKNILSKLTGHFLKDYFTYYKGLTYNESYRTQISDPGDINKNDRAIKAVYDSLTKNIKELDEINTETELTGKDWVKIFIDVLYTHIKHLRFPLQKPNISINQSTKNPRDPKFIYSDV